MTETISILREEQIASLKKMQQAHVATIAGVKCFELTDELILKTMGGCGLFILQAYEKEPEKKVIFIDRGLKSKLTRNEFVSLLFHELGHHHAGDRMDDGKPMAKKEWAADMVAVKAGYTLPLATGLTKAFWYATKSMASLVPSMRQKTIIALSFSILYLVRLGGILWGSLAHR